MEEKQSQPVHHPDVFKDLRLCAERKKKQNKTAFSTDDFPLFYPDFGCWTSRALGSFVVCAFTCVCTCCMCVHEYTRVHMCMDIRS